MGEGRNRRRPKRPLAHALLIAAAAGLLAAAAAGTWRLAHRTHEAAPAPALAVAGGGGAL